MIFPTYLFSLTLLFSLGHGCFLITTCYAEVNIEKGDPRERKRERKTQEKEKEKEGGNRPISMWGGAEELEANRVGIGVKGAEEGTLHSDLAHRGNRNMLV